MEKLIVKFGSTTNVSGETISEGTDISWPTAKTEFSKMDVVLNVKTLSGTSPTITFSIQESIDSNVFMETAKSAAISGTGVYVLSRHALPNTVLANSSGAFPSLGAGKTKQVVTTAGGTVGAVSADIYFIFYKN